MNELTAYAHNEELRIEDQDRRNAKRRSTWARRWHEATGKRPAPAHRATLAICAQHIRAAQEVAAWVDGDLDAICRPAAEIVVHPAWFERGLRRPRYGNQGRVGIARKPPEVA